MPPYPQRLAGRERRGQRLCGAVLEAMARRGDSVAVVVVLVVTNLWLPGAMLARVPQVW
jgi:hypothetical protein